MAQVREKLKTIIKKNLSQSIGVGNKEKGNIIPAKMETTNVSLK
jgi:hypothetical protein